MPLINTVPSVEFVIVSSFSNITPVEPVTSKEVLAVTEVNAPVDAEVPPNAVPSIDPPVIATLSEAWVEIVPKPREVLAVAPLSTTHPPAEPTITLPSELSRPAIAVKSASIPCFPSN